MTLSTRVATTVLLVASGLSLAAQQATFKAGVRTVPIYATVIDAQKRLVPDLTKEDFEILDNEKLQELTLFVNEVQPITVVTMLDTSASMTGNLKLLENGAEQFLMRLLPKDKGMVGAFNDKIEFFPSTFTGDRDRLIRALRDLDFGNPTRLYDAVSESIDKLKGIDGRRVVLVFTDGDDTGSSVGQGKVLEKARNEEVMIYAIGLRSEYFNGQRQVRSKPDSGLKQLAEETGGGYFELDKGTDLAPTFTRVAQELHSQYVLGFAPAALDGKVHKLVTRVKKPGMTVRARRSYVASAE
ncbi:MAG: VWA domain-containing protein [Vicinamibacterales bacterium]|nr:VWA domain-containing protein [Vicinamibacterales bacterium]